MVNHTRLAATNDSMLGPTQTWTIELTTDSREMNQTQIP